MRYILEDMYPEVTTPRHRGDDFPCRQAQEKLPKEPQFQELPPLRRYRLTPCRYTKNVKMKPGISWGVSKVDALKRHYVNNGKYWPKPHLGGWTVIEV